MGNITGTKWQPVGDQFAAACSVCIHRGESGHLEISNTCKECRCEIRSGFEFDPHLYIEQVKEYTKEKYYCYGKDQDKYCLICGMRGSGKVFHLERMLEYKQFHLEKAREEIRRLEDELNTIKEQRDMWKQLFADISQLLKWMMRKEDSN